MFVSLDRMLNEEHFLIVIMCFIIKLETSRLIKLWQIFILIRWNNKQLHQQTTHRGTDIHRYSFMQSVFFCMLARFYNSKKTHVQRIWQLIEHKRVTVHRVSLSFMKIFRWTYQFSSRTVHVLIHQFIFRPLTLYVTAPYLSMVSLVSSSVSPWQIPTHLSSGRVSLEILQTLLSVSSISSSAQDRQNGSGNLVLSCFYPTVRSILFSHTK